MGTMDKRKNFTLICGEEKSLAQQKAELRAYMKKQRTLVDNKDVKEKLMIDNFFAALKQLGKEDAKTFFVYIGCFTYNNSRI